MTDCPLVSIVVHCGSARDPTSAIHLIKALSKIDDEVQAVVELGKAKSGLIDSLFENTKR